MHHSTSRSAILSALGLLTLLCFVPLLHAQSEPAYSSFSIKATDVPGAGTDPRIAAGAQWRSSGVPALDEAGSVAFAAKWHAGVVLGHGVFAGQPAELMAAAGDAAPGADGATFAKFGDPLLSRGVAASGAIAFPATLSGAGITTADDTGLWSNAGGELVLVAREGQIAPTTSGAAFAKFGTLTFVEDEVLFTATLRGAGLIGRDNDLGVWRWSAAGGLQLVLREGQAVPAPLGMRVVSAFEMLGTVPLSAGHGRHHLRAGLFAARVLCTDKSVVDTLIDATSGVPVFLPLAQTGQAIFIGLAPATLNVPAGNAAGGAAFSATFKTARLGPTSRDNAAILAVRGGAWEIVARKGAPATATGKWSAFGNPVMNEAGDVAWLSTLLDTGASGSTVLALSRAGGAPEIVARAHEAAPDTGGGVFTSFLSLALTESGPLFVANLLAGPGGVTSANDLGLWGTSASGELRLLLREGQVLEGRTVKFMSVLANVAGSPGQARSFNARGDVAVKVTFSDASESIVTIALP